MPIASADFVNSATRKIETVAHEKFGFDSLRPGQREAIEAVVSGRDTLVVQPTGSGKSAIYQIAGLLIEGSTLVISPLIALQKDQVDALRSADLESAPAAAVNSTQTASELDERLRDIEKGKMEYIFLGPEQLQKPEAVEVLQNAGISLFVVDEAHCISEWGHDFRPDYLRLGAAIEALGHPRVLALTATATPAVRSEIVERLGMRKPFIQVRGFDRPNIYLRVDHFETLQEKRDALVHRVRWAAKPGIVYVGTRKAAEEIMRGLASEDISALFYHGGLRGRDREIIQERFMSGEADVIVATNAFGMGVDKANVRFVYHYDIPESLDAYYQEIGRAGRDGERSEAALFYRRQDIGAQSFKTGQGRMDPRMLEDLLTRVSRHRRAMPSETLATELGMSKRKLTAILQRLEDLGALQWTPEGEVRAVRGTKIKEVAEHAAAEQERRSKAARERLTQMRDYASSKLCRRELLLRYLGDEYSGPCKFCDNCDAAMGRPQVDPSIGTRREVGA